MQAGTRNLIVLSACVGAVCIGLGVIIGWFSHTSDPIPKWVPNVEKQLQDLDESTILKYLEEVTRENIRSNLQYLAEKPHMATTPEDEALAKYIDDKWKEYLDESEIVTREFLMSFPSDDPTKKNIATVYNADGSVNMTTRTTEDVYDDYMKYPESIVQYYNAFGPPGTVQGKLVYGNFGSQDDLEYLESQGVNLNGTILLTKYGGVGRGARTVNAKPYGVRGVLVYSDPENYVLDGDEGYPDDFSLPPSGVQRGSTLSASGDPSTPLYPSLKSAYRIPVDENPYFPVLPLQPIAYEDAEKLIKLLANLAPVKEGWITGLNNKVLNIGPGFMDGGDIKLEVYNEYKYVESQNVIGKIRGSTEPDDWVMYGNHRDSWVYGAVDPSSGTACMLEITRVLGTMLKQGWRPKRTMVFGSWGAEEFGLIGSVEWAQEKANLLQERSIIYINVDIAVFGNDTFHARGSPLTSNLFPDAAKMVPDPHDGSKTVFDTWKEYYPDPSDESRPLVRRLYSGSDFVYFYHALGVTSADLSYRGDPNNPRYQLSIYPAYHTAYDTFDYVDRFVDPGFYSHDIVCKVAGSALLMVADSLIIPFAPQRMATYVQNQIVATATTYSGQYTANQIDYLKEAGDALKAAVDIFMNYIENTLDRTKLVTYIYLN
ncbi:aminopeptidase NAALADL1-like [Styela clava]